MTSGNEWNLRVQVGVILLVLISLASVSARGADAGPGMDARAVAFRSARGFAVIVPVFINGAGPYDFLLDTGSTCTAIDRELQATLQLATAGDGTVTTLMTRTTVSVAVARSVRVGPVTEERVEVLVRDLGGLRRLDPELRGVLGQNALQHADYLLDYEHKTMEFERGGELLASLKGQRTELIRIPAADNAGYWTPAVRGMIADGDVRGRTLVLDSGAASLVLFAEQPAMHAGALGAMGDDEGNRREVRLQAVELRVANRSWQLPAHVTAFRAREQEIDGLLPTSLFRSVYVSNTGNFVMFAPKWKRRGVRNRVMASLRADTGGRSGGR